MSVVYSSPLRDVVNPEPPSLMRAFARAVAPKAGAGGGGAGGGLGSNCIAKTLAAPAIAPAIPVSAVSVRKAESIEQPFEKDDVIDERVPCSVPDAADAST